MVGCEKSNVVEKDTGVVVETGINSIKEITIDGCQYIYLRDIYVFGITHKGNCTNWSQHNCVKKLK